MQQCKEIRIEDIEFDDPRFHQKMHRVGFMFPTLLAEAVGFAKLDDWQWKVLNSRSRRIILNCARQSGKSTTVSILALQKALMEPGSLILVISHTYQQAGETFRKIMGFYRRAGRVKFAVSETVHRLELENGSRVVTLTGQRPDSIRGFSAPKLLIIDEASQVLDESYQEALRPMLAVSDGQIILLSTPHGKRGFYWEAWRDFEDENKEHWEGIKISADQCPRISRDFLAEEKRQKPEWQFEQEYYNFFAEGVLSVFKTEDVQAAFHPEISAWDDIDVSVD